MKSGCTSTQIRPKTVGQITRLKNPSAPKDVIRDSRTSRWRAAALITLTAVDVAHVVQWWMTGSTVCRSSLRKPGFTLQSGASNAGFIFSRWRILPTIDLWAFRLWLGLSYCPRLPGLLRLAFEESRVEAKAVRSRLTSFRSVGRSLDMFVWPTVYSYFAGPPGTETNPPV